MAGLIIGLGLGLPLGLTLGLLCAGWLVGGVVRRLRDEGIIGSSTVPNATNGPAERPGTRP